MPLALGIQSWPKIIFENPGFARNDRFNCNNFLTSLSGVVRSYMNLTWSFSSLLISKLCVVPGNIHTPMEENSTLASYLLWLWRVGMDIFVNRTLWWHLMCIFSVLKNKMFNSDFGLNCDKYGLWPYYNSWSDSFELHCTSWLHIISYPVSGS